MVSIKLIGRWDDFEYDAANPARLLEFLTEIDAASEFETLKQALYTPLELSGTFVIRGIDTAANSYPERDEVALDKLGQPLTIEVTPNMGVYDIIVAMVKCADSKFEGFPHHHWFEWLDIDPVARTLTFDMGS